MNQDINVEEVLKMMCTIDGASEYLVTNSEGNPSLKSKEYPLREALILHPKKPFTFHF